MSVALYMDEHVPGPITRALRSRGADVLTVQEDGMAGAADPDVIDRATKIGRPVVSNDEDFEREAARRQRNSEHFSGVIFVHFNRISTRQCLEELELICVAGSPADFADRVTYIPL